MAHRLRLVRHGIETLNHTYYGNYRMRIEVTGYEGEQPEFDPCIFVYRRGSTSPYQAEPTDTFVAVAGLPQFSSIPAQTPDVDNGWPHYRLSYVELDFPTQALADEVWQIIQAEVAILCQAFDNYPNLVEQEVLWVPSMPDEGDSVASVSY